MPLATVLRLNAASCLSFGLIFLAAPWNVAAFLGTAPVWLIVSLGVGLIGNGVLLWLSAREARAPKRAEVLFFCLGDLGWVVMTLALILTGLWITTPAGQGVALIVALAVGAMGWMQWQALPR